MPSNNSLITTAASTILVANGTNDVIFGQDIATAYIVSNGDVGDDTILTFRKNDSLINYRSIGDTVDAGENGVIAVDGAGGADQLTLVAADGGGVNLRYLGSKDGGHAYADASVRLAGFTEGKVTNDSFDASSGSYKFFYDNALGLNLGFDTINGFGADDQIVTTRQIFDNDDNATIGFGSNDVLDLSGEGGPKSSDGFKHPGGQIDLNGVGHNMVSIDFLYQETINGVTYFHYGIDG
ncbi:hypothetical protein ASE90_15115 [Sphingomonas sp. Leaf67]|uniref:hypothetical protein n=1 Tax=Sphingomonas sp. Leaf67 TaxID=1736230 RepID=UPI0006F6E6CC|nr:hypothetical protein [Sphingomonas sp. Leaf67]KQN80249.1 hypothetical protein ASE90_15115 [Sphingomonas sp. Leaf67]